MEVKFKSNLSQEPRQKGKFNLSMHSIFSQKDDYIKINAIKIRT